MYSSTITINNIDTAREFVDEMSKFLDTDITLISGDYRIDGHSIIGLISLDFSKPILVEAKGNVSDELIEILKKYDI